MQVDTVYALQVVAIWIFNVTTFEFLSLTTHAFRHIILGHLAGLSGNKQ